MTQLQMINSYGPVLRRTAARMVRSKADVEDLVQDTFLKWLSLDARKIHDAKAYLLKTLVNNALNHIRALKRKKEQCVDFFTLSDRAAEEKESDFALDMSIHLRAALDMVQHKLCPLERAVYLLREVFNFDYAELQETLREKQAYCRQIFSRAKKKLHREQKRTSPHLSDDIDWRESFEKACRFGFLNDLIERLQRDVNPALAYTK